MWWIETETHRNHYYNEWQHSRMQLWMTLVDAITTGLCSHNAFNPLFFLTRLFRPPLIKGTCHMFRQGSRVCFYSHMDASMKRWPFCVQGSYVILISQCQGQVECVREEIRLKCNCNLVTKGKLDFRGLLFLCSTISKCAAATVPTSTSTRTIVITHIYLVSLL